MVVYSLFLSVIKNKTIFKPQKCTFKGLSIVLVNFDQGKKDLPM